MKSIIFYHINKMKSNNFVNIYTWHKDNLEILSNKKIAKKKK